MRETMVAAACVIGLWGCSGPAPQAVAPDPGQATVEPSETLRQTFAECRWGRVDSATLSVWSYACPAAAGGMRLVADESLPGFAIETAGDGGTTRQPAIIAFQKSADAPVTAVLDAVRVRSPGPHTATCELVSAAGQSPEPAEAFVFVPTGAVKTAWDRQEAGKGVGESMEPPCGPLGVQMSGDRSFRQVAGDPTTVVFIEYGSEIQIFDPATLSARTAH